MHDTDKPEPTILHFEYGMRLRLAEDDSLIFDALCGRVGELGVEFILNQAERDRYKHDGDAFLQELATMVRANPKEYAARGRYY